MSRSLNYSFPFIEFDVKLLEMVLGDHKVYFTPRDPDLKKKRERGKKEESPLYSISTYLLYQLIKVQT